MIYSGYAKRGERLLDVKPLLFTVQWKVKEHIHHGHEKTVLPPFPSKVPGLLHYFLST